MYYNFQLANLQSQIHEGFVALSTILLVSAVMLAVLGTMTYLAIGEGQASLALELGESNLALVEGCAEDLLQKVHDNPSFNETVITRPPGEGNCALSYSQSGPTNWDVTVTSNQTNFQRQVRVVFIRTTQITITSWQEI